jgi:hypothetical protein
MNLNFYIHVTQPQVARTLVIHNPGKVIEGNTRSSLDRIVQNYKKAIRQLS